MLAKTFSASKTFGLPVHSIIKKTSLRSPFLIVAALCLFSTAFAQSYQGALRGSLHDSTGNALTNATLTLVNTATNQVRITTTNSAGEYFFEKVDPGKYKLDASAAGFKKLERSGVIVETQQQITLG